MAVHHNSHEYVEKYAQNALFVWYGFNLERGLNMKRIFCLIMVAMLAVSCTACGQDDDKINEVSSQETVTQSVVESSVTVETADTPDKPDTPDTPDTPTVPDVKETPDKAEKTEISVMSFTGTPSMGLAKLMGDADKDKAANDYSFEYAKSSDELIKAFKNNKVDIASCSIDLATKIYKETDGSVQIAAAVGYGDLYLLENGKTVKSIEDLKGKTVYAYKGDEITEYLFSYILDINNIDIKKDIKVEYTDDIDELLESVKDGKADFVLLPEPYAAQVSKENKYNYSLDISKEWEDANDGKLVKECIIVSKKFAEKNTESVDAFLKEYKESVAYTEDYLADSCKLMEKYGIADSAELAKSAIKNCNLTCVVNDEMKDLAEDTIITLYKFDKSSIGGALPNDDFYYIAKTDTDTDEPTDSDKSKTSDTDKATDSDKSNSSKKTSDTEQATNSDKQSGSVKNSSDTSKSESENESLKSI
ncbi:MAG: transporter substrate-binding domain-containing protein [Lachnospiraceae bacterium]|nr:transporter substrate-binding domain-containing protein [Lachnospiraceae bacterium]